MAHTQVVSGSNGDWVFTLPNQITLSQGGSTTNLVLDASQPGLPILTFEVNYDLDAFGNPDHALTIGVQEPGNDADSGLFGLRGSVEFKISYSLPQDITSGGGTSFVIAARGNEDLEELRSSSHIFAFSPR